MIDHHSICAECGKLINTIIHKHEYHFGNIYHEFCFHKMCKNKCDYPQCPSPDQPATVHEYTHSPFDHKPMKLHLSCWTRWRDLGFQVPE